jgi:hypothetical protein
MSSRQPIIHEIPAPLLGIFFHDDHRKWLKLETGARDARSSRSRSHNDRFCQLTEVLSERLASTLHPENRSSPNRPQAGTTSRSPKCELLAEIPGGKESNRDRDSKHERSSTESNV